ncbi:MAG TPA: Ig-like domain-containing protein, partial [Limnobacter sp.]|nr:Ig-like domain-containing protein [Limnobacter sp.]
MLYLYQPGLQQPVAIKSGEIVRIPIESDELPQLRLFSPAGQPLDAGFEYERRGSDLIIRGPDSIQLVLEGYARFCETAECMPIESMVRTIRVGAFDSEVLEKKIRVEDYFDLYQSTELMDPVVFTPASLGSPVQVQEGSRSEAVRDDSASRTSVLITPDTNAPRPTVAYEPPRAAPAPEVSKADTTSPSIEISCGTSTLAAGQSATITFTLSEASSDFTLSDIQVQGGSLSNFTGSGASYSATFTPTPQFAGTASIHVASNSFTDAVGNSNEDGAETNNSVSLLVDTVRP